MARRGRAEEAQPPGPLTADSAAGPALLLFPRQAPGNLAAAAGSLSDGSGRAGPAASATGPGVQARQPQRRVPALRPGA